MLIIYLINGIQKTDINTYVDINDFILISKDADFKNSHFINKTPKKLVKINLGNISNEELITIFNTILIQIEKVHKAENIFIIEINKEFTQITFK